MFEFAHPWSPQKFQSNDSNYPYLLLIAFSAWNLKSNATEFNPNLFNCGFSLQGRHSKSIASKSLSSTYRFSAWSSKSKATDSSTNPLQLPTLNLVLYYSVPQPFFHGPLGQRQVQINPVNVMYESIRYHQF